MLRELIGGTDLEDLVADLARSEDRRPHPAEPLVELAAFALDSPGRAGTAGPVHGLRER